MRAWLHADGGANESMSPQLGIKQVGARVHLQWVIYFPWVPDAGKFKGEVIYSIRHLENGVPARENVQPR